MAKECMYAATAVVCIPNLVTRWGTLRLAFEELHELDLARFDMLKGAFRVLLFMKLKLETGIVHAPMPGFI